MKLKIALLEVVKTTKSSLPLNLSVTGEQDTYDTTNLINHLQCQYFLAQNVCLAIKVLHKHANGNVYDYKVQNPDHVSLIKPSL